LLSPIGKGLPAVAAAPNMRLGPAAESFILPQAGNNRVATRVLFTRTSSQDNNTGEVS
jgi:hypothetical protein